MRTGPSTRPVPATRPARTWTRRWSMRRSRHSPAPASPTSTSAVSWVYGANPSITEESPFNAPALVAWREPIEQRVLDASGMRGVVIVSGVAYGDGGGGIPGLLLGSPRDDAGNLIMLGTGQQHWSTVHVADLADFFRRALEDDSARGHYVVGDGLNPTVAELTEAAAVAAGAPGAVPGSDEEARARLGDYFAEVLLLDQGTDAAKARAELDWSPVPSGTRRRVPQRELPQASDGRLTNGTSKAQHPGSRKESGDDHSPGISSETLDRLDPALRGAVHRRPRRVHRQRRPADHRQGRSTSRSRAFPGLSTRT